MDHIGSQPYDEEPVPRELKRTNAHLYDMEALEDPMDEEEGDSDDQPDLGEYFAQWDITPKEQILMCRSYASYLSVRKSPFKHADKK